AKTEAVPYDGLVMVSRDACTGHRIGASGMAGPRRPIHLLASDRPVYSRYLGGGRSNSLMASSTDNRERCCINCPRRFELMRVRSDIVLARQRDTVQACACGNQKQRRC